MKLWQKNIDVNEAVENFTVGNDGDFDLQLAAFDVLGSMAHAKMLSTVGLLSAEDAASLITELKKIYTTIPNAPYASTVAVAFPEKREDGMASPFFIMPGVEDVHSQVELFLTERLGDVGKKIHSARSRNDQVLVDLKLFLRNEIEELVHSVAVFFELLQQKSEAYKAYSLPGYTHLQLAMPSTFGLWFGAYAESLVDDLITLRAAYDVVNKNPLGSAAGYGSSFPIDRSLTTSLLGFEKLNYNVVYAQMGRGKAERVTAQALANLADTLARMSMDVCLFLNQNFDFISFPPELTTGSSIMPHKKNPDVFELIRAHCNRIKALPNEIMMMTTNLPSGYHRDLQLLKEHLFPAFSNLDQCISMATLMLDNIIVKEDIMADEKYKYAFSVDEVNRLVLQGMPFRDAYKKVGKDIEENKFSHGPKPPHTHEGAADNLQNEAIRTMMEEVLSGFNFSKANTALQQLLL